MRFLFLFLLVSCNPISPLKAHYYGVEADFSIYVNKFNEELALIGQPPVSLNNITFYSTPVIIERQYAGICSKGDDRYKISVVTMDSKVFDMATYYVVVHELGHCSYNLHHIAGAGIMNANGNVGTDFTQLDNRLELIKQMLGVN